MTYGLPDSALIGTAKRIAHSGSRYSSLGASRGRLAIDFGYKFKGLVFRRPTLDWVLNNPRGDVGRYMRRRGVWMMTAAKGQVGKKTGMLEKSIKLVHSRGSLGQFMSIGSALNYALVHHQGSRPHIITPNDANILRFSAGGRIIYTHKVNHPGTRPNRYLSDQLWMVKI